MSFLHSDSSTVQSQLIDINNRYDVLGRRLTDREAELESGRRAVIQYRDELQDVLTWLDDKEQLILPLETLPANEPEATDKLKEHQVSIT